MDMVHHTWILGGVTAALVYGISWWFSPWERQERALKQLQDDMDVLDTHIRNFLMTWWKNNKGEDPAYRWRLKVSMVSGKGCAYAWRHCRRYPGEPMKVIVHSKYWDHFEGGMMDRDNRIMDEALSFVQAAFEKKAIPISGSIRDQDDD